MTFKQVLRVGSKGEDVRQLQKALGFPDPTDYFGSLTEESVKKFQQLRGLSVDGIVGEETWRCIFSTQKPEVAQAANCELSIAGLKFKLPENIYNELPMVMERFDIDRELELAHFLAQCSHESQGFKKTRENLNYSADGLKENFGRHFSDAELNHYAHQPERIANRVYAKRMGNGTEASGDGWNFRGAGAIELTGRYMFNLFSEFVGEDCVANPELVATKYFLTSAGFFFKLNDIWSVCARGDTKQVVTAVTRKINPELVGLDKRIILFKDFHCCLKG